MKQRLAAPMNKWGIISQDTLVAFGKSAANCKFIDLYGLV